jgi:hypothetical protein
MFTLRWILIDLSNQKDKINGACKCALEERKFTQIYAKQEINATAKISLRFEDNINVAVK